MNITGNVLQHVQHIEDGVIFGPENADLSYRSLVSLYDTLKGNTPEGVKISTKVDGAPSVACASDFNGRTFVAYKSALDSIVNPQYDKDGNRLQPDLSKICFTEEDVKRVYGSETEGKGPKMLALMKYAKSIGIPKNEIWQGDFMFSHDELFYETIDGEERVCFHPNTIIYSIDLNDPLADKIEKADYCVIWHTKYVGTDFGDLHISFDVDSDRLPKNEKFLSLDANINNIAGRVTLTDEETQECENVLNSIKNELDELKKDTTYLNICGSRNFRERMLSFMNYLIKSQHKVQFIENYVESFVKYVSESFDNKIDSLKKESSKDSWKNKKNKFIDFVFSHEDTFNKILDVQKKMVFVKELFEKKLNTIPQKYKNYVQYKNNNMIVPIGQEGFCISDIDGNLQKVVSRLSFSLNNFDPNILKGWESDRRKSQYKISEADENYPKNVQSVSNNLADVVDQLLGDDLDVKKTNRISNRKDFVVDMNVSPKDSDVERTSIWSDMKLDAQDNVINDVEISNSQFFIGGKGSNTTPHANISISSEQNDNLEKDTLIKFNFKPKEGVGGSATNTAIQESTVAKFVYYLLYNIPIPSKEDMDEEQGSYNWYSNSKGNSSWYYSYVRSAREIVKLLDPNEEYIVSRCGSCVYPEGYANAHDLVNSLSKGGAKDSWNPSDIYLCKKSFLPKLKNDVIEYKNKNISDINKYLKNNLLSKNLIGISLKKLISDDVYTTPINVEKNKNLNLGDTYQFYDGEKSIKVGKIPPLVYNDKVIEYLNSPKRIHGFRKKGVVLFGLLNNSNKEVSLDYRPFGENYFYLQTGFKGSDSQFGKLPVTVLNNFLKKYEVQIPENFEDPILNDYVTHIYDSGLVLTDSLGTTLNLVTWQNAKSQLRRLSLDSEMNTIFYQNQWCKILCVLEMFAKSILFDEFKKLHNGPNGLFNQIIFGCKKASLQCAPYYLISNSPGENI